MAAITGAVLGLATTAVSVGMSVSAANKASNERAKAQKAAEKALEEAKKEISRMPMQELSLNLDVYEQSREAQQRGIQQVMSQAELDPRQAAAVGGRAMMAGIEGERGIRTDQAKEMFELDKIKAQERQDASNALKDLGIQEAAGAQAAAADAATRQAAATQQAIVSGAEGIKGAMNLYSAVQGAYDKTPEGRAAKAFINSMGIDAARNAVGLNLPEGSTYSHDQVLKMTEMELASLLQSGAFGDVAAIKNLQGNFNASMYK
jgi:hypothetical protein